MMFRNLRKIKELKYKIEKFEQAFNEQDNYINRLELIIRNQDGRIEKLHDINGKLVMQNKDLINNLKHVEKEYFKLKKEYDE